MSEKGIKVGYRSKNVVTDYSMQLGKLPPQAVDMEEAVLGAMMLERKSITTVIDILHAETFYKDAHQNIFSAIVKLFNAAKPVDILTVTEQLRKDGLLEVVGGSYYVVELTQKINSAANIEQHARIILERYIKREMIMISTEIQQEAYEDQTDVFNLIELVESRLFQVSHNISQSEIKPLSIANEELAKDVVARQNMEREVSGVPSGFRDIDRVTGGWQAPDLIIIAARPGMGKTAFVVTGALNSAELFKEPVAIFSLEMSSKQLAARIMAQKSSTPVNVILKEKLDDYVMSNFLDQMDKLSDVPIFLDDTPGISIMELRAKCRRLMNKVPLKLIIVDYIQLMTAGKDKYNMNREQEISTISRNLKGLAKELGVPVIALSQLSRAVETRGGSKRPLLSDLRESGAIEQDADIVSFLYRPDYYGITQDGDHFYGPGETEFIFAKHRNGALDTVNLTFKHKLTRFTDLVEPELREISINDELKSEDQKEKDDLPF